MNPIPNITLRPWLPSDLNNLVKYINNFNVSQFLTTRIPYPYTAADGEWFINYANFHNPTTIFAIEFNKQAVGSIGLHTQADLYTKSVELGYWLGEPFWNKGIANQAVKQIIHFGFSNLDINRIFARLFATNTPSQKLLQKNNFTLEGNLRNAIFKNGNYFDELLYSLLHENWQA